MRNELASLQRRLGTTTVYVTHDQTEAMTLGDRIAVLRRGEVQQIGSPRELYLEPANLFVARFIGAPAMNLLPARIGDDGRLHLPMTTLPLPERFRDSLPAGIDNVIAGIRPEHFRAADAALAGADDGAFRIRAGFVEWLGADLFVHFEVPAAGARGLAALRQELELDKTGDARGEERLKVAARIGGGSPLREGEEIALAIDSAGLLLFDGDSGVRLRADGP